ncbi:MAG: hypothetical protein QOE80_1467 [Actinomycetota bacterium]|jgi:hypothetical protein|nr:hypothetical protein [Actinomycetota bacterium]
MANRAVLIVSDAFAPPIEYEPASGLLAANYSVPIFWLSLFTSSDLVTWPCTLDHNATYTAVHGTRNSCLENSRARLARWSDRWPEAFGALSSSWLEFIEGVDRRFIGVWTEAISDMSGDETWANVLLSYLLGLDDLSSPGFREALGQSYLGLDVAKGTLRPTEEGPVSLLAAGYSWSQPAPWE